MSSAGVDTHAHVFRRDLPMAPDRRYTPAYDASPTAYLAELDAAGLDRALLVQPSFLGTDLDHLRGVLADHPHRFRGVGVVAGARPEDVGDLHAAGFRGLRLNLVGRSAPDLSAGRWPALAEQMAHHRWHLEVQASGSQWTGLERDLAGWRGTVVLDHLGLPRDGDGREVVGLAALDHVWVKLSAPYRSPGDAVAARLDALRSESALERTVFGSDWPFTQHEAGRSLRSTLDWCAGVLEPGEADRVTANGRRFVDALWPADG